MGTVSTCWSCGTLNDIKLAKLFTQNLSHSSTHTDHHALLWWWRWLLLEQNKLKYRNQSRTQPKGGKIVLENKPRREVVSKWKQQALRQTQTLLLRGRQRRNKRGWVFSSFKWTVFPPTRLRQKSAVRYNWGLTKSKIFFPVNTLISPNSLETFSAF